MRNPYILAKNICKTLFEKGYTAYFAGGWVRDLLLKKTTDEIDIATSAPPYVVQDLFDKTIPVGVAFGVVIVVLEGMQFEVSTFRKDHKYIDGRHPAGVDFSTPEKDAERRDFTINGMFFDPLTETLYDYVGGKEDLQKGIIRAIGNPYERFEEDRLRMIRAVRFSSRLGFPLEKETEEAIIKQAGTLFPSVSIERVWQEMSKMAAYPHLELAIQKLHQLGLLQVIFPQLQEDSLAEIEKRTTAFPYFPVNAPLIAYLVELFPTLSLEEKLRVCVYLKTSIQDRKLVEFFAASQELFSKQTAERYDWAHFYAHPLAELFLGIAAAKVLPPRKILFLKEHEERQKKLQPHIERIRKKQPLVTSSHLKERGIQPGKEMGSLLKAAERIAINEDHRTSEAVLKKLLF